jgi:hypothetical protein
VLDVVLTLAFIALPLTTWWLSRSITFTAVGLILGFGIAGNLVQSTVAWGVAWEVRGLQLLALAIMVAVLVLARWGRNPAGDQRRQWMGIGVPIAMIGLLLTTMRLLAPDDPGALTGLGYLVSHPMGEDNAKFLNLAAQLADGRTIAFNGYAAGPLLLLMSVITAGVSVLSTVLLGGVNQVAVVLNTVIGAQHLMIILAPVAFAPVVERWASSKVPRVPLPLIWTGVLLLTLVTLVLTEYGHLSLQFVVILLVLWALSFLADTPWWAKVGLTLSIATTASVWLPLNMLGLAVIVGVIVWAMRARTWWGLALAVVVFVVSWDALITSLLFVLGIQIDLTPNGVEPAPRIDLGPFTQGASAVVAQSSEIFTIGGGTERVLPLLGGAAIAVAIAAVVLMRRWLADDSRTEWSTAGRFAPFLIFGAYVVAITAGDAISSGAAPHYGAIKIAFALAVMTVAAYLPVAGMALPSGTAGMGAARWLAIAGVIVLLTWDSLLPRALNAVSPARWAGVDESAPIYWAAAEVKDTGEQPLSSLPVACVVAPPHAPQPSALPWGQETYSCTRLLLGMNGLEGRTGFTNGWLGSEWVQQRSLWNEVYPNLRPWTKAVATRPIIILDRDARLAGLTTFADLIRMNDPGHTR